MDWITWTAIGALALLGIGVWLYVRRNPAAKAPDDDQGATPRGLGEDE